MDLRVRNGEGTGSVGNDRSKQDTSPRNELHRFICINFAIPSFIQEFRPLGSRLPKFLHNIGVTISHHFKQQERLQRPHVRHRGRAAVVHRHVPGDAGMMIQPREIFDPRYYFHGIHSAVPPFSLRTVAVSLCPILTAMSSGVFPFTFILLGFAPPSKRSSTI